MSNDRVVCKIDVDNTGVFSKAKCVGFREYKGTSVRMSTVQVVKPKQDIIDSLEYSDGDGVNFDKLHKDGKIGNLNLYYESNPYATMTNSSGEKVSAGLAEKALKSLLPILKLHGIEYIIFNVLEPQKRLGFPILRRCPYPGYNYIVNSFDKSPTKKEVRDKWKKDMGIDFGSILVGHIDDIIKYLLKYTSARFICTNNIIT